MTERTAEAARIDRLFLIASIPAFIFFAACMYVRFTTDNDPLWSELGTPVLFTLLGVRTMVRPTAPESRNTNRAIGLLLVILSAVLAGLAIYNFQGAN